MAASWAPQPKRGPGQPGGRVSCQSLAVLCVLLSCGLASSSQPGLEYDYGVSPKLVCTPIPLEADPSCYSPPGAPRGAGGHGGGHNGSSRRTMLSEEAKATILHLRESLVRQKELILDQRETIRELTAKLTLCEGYGGHRNTGRHNNGYHDNHQNKYNDHRSYHGPGAHHRPYHGNDHRYPQGGHRPDPHHPDTHHPDTHHSDPHHPDPHHPDPHHPDPHHPDPHHPEPQHPDPHHPDPHHPDPHQPDPHHPEPHHPEPHHPEPSSSSVDQMAKTLQTLKERLENLQARNSSSSYSSSLRDLLQRKITALEEQLHNQYTGHHNDRHASGHHGDHRDDRHDARHAAGREDNHRDDHHDDHLSNGRHDDRYDDHRSTGHNDNHHDDHHNSPPTSSNGNYRYTPPRHHNSRPYEHHHDWYYGPSPHSNYPGPGRQDNHRYGAHGDGRDDRHGSGYHDDHYGSGHRADHHSSGPHDGRHSSGHHHDHHSPGHHNDHHSPGPHDDRLSSGHHDDHLSPGPHDDRLSSGHHDDHLSSGHHDDHLSSGPHDDRLSSGHHDDHLSSGHHDDRLHGIGKLDAILSRLYHRSPEPVPPLKNPDAFQISFPVQTNYMHARFTTPVLKEIFALTICLWLRGALEGPGGLGGQGGQGLGTPFSYAVPGQANELVLIEWGSNPMELLVDDKAVKLPLRLSDRKWHHVCVTWSTRGGSWEAYLDGRREGSGDNLAAWRPVRPGGTFLLGQEQDSMGGGFDASQSLVGDVSDLQFWSRVLSPGEVSGQASCEAHLTGDVLSWSQASLELHGGVARQPFLPCH